MARDFNGTTDRIDWANVFNVTGQAMTFSAWVYPDAVNTDSYIFNFQTAGDASVTLLMFINGSLGAGRIQLSRLTDATAKTRRTADGALGTGAWHHVLMKDDGLIGDSTTIQIWIDGVQVDIATDAQNGTGTQRTGTGTWCLGGRTFDDLRNFNGRIAEASVWTRQLTTAEIVLLSKGISPASIAGSLSFYPILNGSYGVEQNFIGGVAGTLDGTSLIAHPKITYPWSLSTLGVGT